MKDKEIEWIYNPLINNSQVELLFKEISSSTGFRTKMSKNQPREFNESDIEVLSEIKKVAQKSISRGEFKFGNRAGFVRELLIPEIKFIKEEYGLKKPSTNYYTVRTLIERKKLSKIMTIAMDRAMDKYKNTIL